MIELADSSAWITSQREPTLNQSFREGLITGSLAICSMVKLELLKSARNGNEFRQRRLALDSIRDYPSDQKVWQRALEVYEELAQLGGSYQRSVQHPDLLIAATAEAAGIGLLHYDEDFDRIADITSQPMRWIAPRGSI